MRKRLAVVVSDHVIHEDDAAQLGPADASRLHFHVHAAVGPVSVRAEYPRHLAGHLGRPVKVAAESEARKGLEDDLLDRVIAAIELAGDLRVERSLGEHRP